MNKKEFNMKFTSIVSISDSRGNIISWSSSGSCGFKGSRKSTPFAAQTATNLALKKAIDRGITQVEINVSGPGSGRETSIRAVQLLGVGIVSIKDVTSIPHNGCRPSKKRRI
jgi:small subunit ribosomal protein S11